MAMKFSFIKLPKNKRFEYTPRFWNPEKEEREARIKRIQNELGIDSSDSTGKPYVSNIRTRFRDELERDRKSKYKPKTGTNRLFIILLILALMVFAVYFLNMKPEPVEEIMK